MVAGVSVYKQLLSQRGTEWVSLSVAVQCERSRSELEKFSGVDEPSGRMRQVSLEIGHILPREARLQKSTRADDDWVSNAFGLV